MFMKFRSLAVTVLTIGVLAASGGAASAQEGGESPTPPRFDAMIMLGVAQAYNLTPAYDLTFPARSPEACEIAGVGTLSIGMGHGYPQFVNSAEGHALIEGSVNEAQESTGNDRSWPCYWLRSGSAKDWFADLHRVWPATLKQNFNKLRKAMNRGDCRKITKRMKKYPRPDRSAKAVRKRVEFAAGGHCRGS